MLFPCAENIETRGLRIRGVFPAPFTISPLGPLTSAIEFAMAKVGTRERTRGAPPRIRESDALNGRGAVARRAAHVRKPVRRAGSCSSRLGLSHRWCAV